MTVHDGWMDDIPSPYDGLDAYCIDKDAAWEEKVVKKLLSVYGLSSMSPALVARCFADTGVRALRFDQFRAEYPDFPVLLLPKRIPYVHQSTWEDMKAKFTRTQVGRAFCEAVEEESSPLAVVYNRPHSGTEVIHDLVAGTQPSFCYYRKINGVEVMIEDFMEFLDVRVRSLWSPR